MTAGSANKIQIKRSTTNAVVTGLSNGELAFTQASNVLFIGLPDGSGVAPIGGVRYPGTLTANQALVANSSSAIDKVIVANAVITYLTANGALGVNSQVLSTNSSGGIYWRDGGSLGTNADAQYTWTNTQTFSNTITFSSTINGTANNSTYAFGKTEVNLNVNNALTSNNASYLGTVAAANYVQNTDSRTLSGNLYLTGANSGFSTSIFIGAQPGATGNSVSANTTALLVGNATVFSTVNSTSFSGSAAFVGGNSAGDLRTYSETQAGNAYTWAMANTLSRNGSYTGNNSLGGTNTVISSNLTISGSILADIVPTGNGTINLGSALNRFGTIYLAGSTISLGNTSLSDEGAGGLTVTNMNVTSGFTSSGNTKLGDSTSDVVSFAARVNTSIVPSANITYNLGASGLRYDQIFSSNVVAEYVNVGKDLAVSGNLYVTGTVAYINTTSFSTTDSLLQFASNNTVTDILDVGFFGQYNQSSTVKYTGLFRDATDGTYALFSGLTEAPGATVNTAAASFGYASLNTYLNSSVLIANSTQTNITANSSVSVSLTANTLNFDLIDAGTF